MNIFGGNSPWERSPFVKSRSLGQVTLHDLIDDPVDATTQWRKEAGYGPYDPAGIPPYWGEWGVDFRGCACPRRGCCGPFDTIEEAFACAVEAALANGALSLPEDGWARVIDSEGKGRGPIV
jgi:hypothetical protein